MDDFLQRVATIQQSKGRAFIVSNEVLFTPDRQILGADSQNLTTDRLGRIMHSLSVGVGHFLADNIWKKLGLQTRVLRPGNLARAMTNCVSPADRDLALLCGRAGGQALLDGLGSRRAEYIAMDATGGFMPRCLSALPEGNRTLDEGFFDGEALGPTDAFKRYAKQFVADVPDLFDTELPPYVHNKTGRQG